MTAQPRDVGRCPVSHTDYRIDRPAFDTYGLLNAEREESPTHWNDTTEYGYWMVNRYDDVVAGLQNPLLTNDQANAFDPTGTVKLLPQNLNGEEHRDLRRVINPYFSPAAVKRLEPLAVDRARTLVDEVAPRGETDLVSDFAIRYPTELFLALMGLPVADGEVFLPWVEDIFLGFFDQSPEAQRISGAAAENIMGYFDLAVAAREKDPRDPDLDLVSRLLQARIKDAPIPREDILTICLTLMAAGLDTTRASLGYMFHHLATHPADRERLLREPRMWPAFIEESIRLYSLIIQDGRQAAEDMDLLGCPVKKGDMVSMQLTAANRDPRKFPEPDRFDMERDNLNHHLGFGAGPHRCVGMHLARAELVIALEAWHARIPHYRLAPDTELVERGGQLRLQSLPLTWEV